VSFRPCREEPPAYLINNPKRTLAGSILKVPGGHICGVVVIENLRRDSLLGPKPQVPISFAAATRVAVPAGTYALDAYELTARAESAFNSE